MKGFFWYGIWLMVAGTILLMSGNVLAGPVTILLGWTMSFGRDDEPKGDG